MAAQIATDADQHRKLVDDLDAAAKLARELGLTTAAYFAEMARDEARTAAS